MKKFKIASIASFILLCASLIFQPVRQVAAQGIYTVMYSAQLLHGKVDDSPIGGTIPSTVNATSVSAASVTSNWAQVNGSPTPAGNNGFTGWGRNGSGDFDFFSANSGASPSFYWYYLLGSTPTIEMYLDTNANLRVPNGGISTLSIQATQSTLLPHYVVSALPSPVTLGTAGAVVVTDCTSYTPGPLSSSCGSGGGSDVMLAISNGTVWTVH
jgi:hypothetical protein